MAEEKLHEEGLTPVPVQYVRIMQVAQVPFKPGTCWDYDNNKAYKVIWAPTRIGAMTIKSAFQKLPSHIQAFALHKIMTDAHFLDAYESVEVMDDTGGFRGGYNFLVQQYEHQRTEWICMIPDS